MGEIYKNYDVLKEIGAGGFSRVYKAIQKTKVAEYEKKFREKYPAYDKNNNKMKNSKGKKPVIVYSTEDLVAVKVIRSRPHDSELKDVAENEVAVMEKIVQLKGNAHNFVQLFDVFREQRRVILVMEYLDGGELFDRIANRTKYSELDAAITIRTIIQGLNALHSVGIVHRDMKPENLVYKYKPGARRRLLESKGLTLEEEEDGEGVKLPPGGDEEDVLKLMDFGLSLFLDGKDPHRDALYVGTPGYIAPEVLSHGKYSPASDIFSAGVILFILLSGRMPFPGKTSAVINDRITSGNINFKPAQWDDINLRAQNLIKRMLEVDPAKRITGEEVLRHTWLLETRVRTGLRNLTNTLDRIRDLNARHKLGDHLKNVLVKASNDLRGRMWRLIGAAQPGGLSLESINRIKAEIIERHGKYNPESAVQNPPISRNEFKSVMNDLGFGDLPIDDIFDAVLDEKSETRSGVSIVGGRPEKMNLRSKSEFTFGTLGGITMGGGASAGETTEGEPNPRSSFLGRFRFFGGSATPPAPAETNNIGNIRNDSTTLMKLNRRSVKPHERAISPHSNNSFEISDEPDAEPLSEDLHDHDDIEGSIRLDDLLVALASVAAMESPETFLKFLFNLFTPSQDPNSNVHSAISLNGFRKIARVMANYREDKPSSNKRHELASRIAQLFSFFDGDSGDDDASVGSKVSKKSQLAVTFEEFNAGVTKFGREVFEEYLAPHLVKFTEKVEQISGQYLPQEQDHRVKLVGTFVKRVASKTIVKPDAEAAPVTVAPPIQLQPPTRAPKKTDAK